MAIGLDPKFTSVGTSGPGAIEGNSWCMCVFKSGIDGARVKGSAEKTRCCCSSAARVCREGNKLGCTYDGATPASNGAVTAGGMLDVTGLADQSNLQSVENWCLTMQVRNKRRMYS